MASEIDLDGDAFFISLHSNNSNCTNLTLENAMELTNEIAGVNGYITGGQVLANVYWDVGARASEMRFTADKVEWMATGDILNVRWAVLRASPSNLLVAFVELFSSPYNVASGNPLTVEFSNEGILELN
jgi:hypothetical protein